MRNSCIKWLETEHIIPTYVLNNIDELDQVEKNNRYFLVLADPDYKYTYFQSQLLNKLSKLGINDYLCPYDYEKIPKHDLNYLDYFSNNIDNLLEMFDLLYDDESKQAYVEYIRSKMFCDFYRLPQNPTWNKYFDDNIYTHLSDEVFVNCGSSNGDTIFYFLEKFNDFSKIYAFEADEERVKQLKDNLNYLPQNINSKIINKMTYVDNLHNKIDDLCGDDDITLINMDIEGMELEALKGARNKIIESKPVIAACAYHLPTDLYELPMFFKEISREYEILYRKYASTIRNRFCNAELVMYAVPKKRLVRK